MDHVPPTIRKGSKSEAVKGLQNALRQRGVSHLDIDGEFGPATETAVRQFQRDAHLNAHIVRSGDTLSGIAEQLFGDANRSHEIFDLNGEIVSDPDRSFPGQVLTLPRHAE